MADLTPREMLQPCLLDRLTDHEPKVQEEGRDTRVVSLRELRNAVLRDLAWLLNAQAQPYTEEIYEYPDAARSVVNLGLPDLSGATASGVDIVALERTVLQVIRTYEPRILANTLSVRVKRADESMATNAVSFEIQGEMWAQPIPEALFVQTQVDLETGQIDVKGRGDG